VAANLVSAQADLINARQQLDALQHPAGETRVTTQINLANAYAGWEKARDTLASSLSSKASTGDTNRYDDIRSTQRDLDEALDDYPLTADPASQWYYWAARMQSLERSGDYNFAMMTAALRSELDRDDADLVDEIIAAQNAYEQAVQDFAGSITSYSASIDVNMAITAYQQTTEELLSASQTAYEALISPNPNDLAAAQAKVEAAQANLNNLAITAPFTGEILSVEQHPGDVVSAGSLALALADRATVYIDAQVDEADIAQVTVGSPATITMDALPGQTLNGRVTFINPNGQTAAGLVRYSVRVELDPVDSPLLLGATADISIQAGESHSVLVVPINAVQNDEGGEFVTVIDSDGSTHRVAVESGEVSGDQVMVNGNLIVGQRVLTDYQSKVQLPNPFAR